MYKLDSHPEIQELPEARHALRGRLMLGTSPGKYGKHEPNAVPLDAVTFMIRAQLAADAVNADGRFLALDKRDQKDKTDPKDMRAIQERTQRLRSLVARVTNLEFITESDLDPEALRATREEWDLENFRGTDNPVYWQRQTAVVLHTLGVANGKMPVAPVYKFGSVKGRDAYGNLIGGEVDFDAYLPSEKGIKFIYAPPAYDRNGVWATPYLLDRSKAKERVCLPAQKGHIDRELRKIDEGVARITYTTYMTTAAVILGESDPVSLESKHLIAMPLDSDRQEIIREQEKLEKLREILHASMIELCE